MTTEITITFPSIPTETIQQLTETEQILAANEIEFIAALRSKYALLANLNGNIRLSDYSVGNQNWQQSGETWLMADGKKLKGLLSADYFSSAKDSEFAGKYTGERLYLTTKGWVEIARTGCWSQWQGSDDYWTCDGSFADEQEFEECNGGGVRWLTDEQVAAKYDVRDVAQTLAASLTTLATKVPERMNRKRALADSLKTIIAQLSR